MQRRKDGQGSKNARPRWLCSDPSEQMIVGDEQQLRKLFYVEPQRPAVAETRNAPMPREWIVLGRLSTLAAPTREGLLAARRAALADFVGRYLPDGEVGLDIILLEGLGSLLVSAQLLAGLRARLPIKGEPVFILEDSRAVSTHDPSTSTSEASAQLRALGHRRNHTNGKGVLIGVVDSGFAPETDEADGLTLHAFATISEQGLIRTDQRPHDRYHRHPSPTLRYHGTKVCARIAGRSDGVAPAASVIMMAALTEADEGAPGSGAKIATALHWLLAQPFGSTERKRCDIINASLTVRSQSDKDDEGLDEALDMAAGLGTLIVAAVGNIKGVSGGPVLRPAGNQHVCAVGAVSQEVGDWKWSPNNFNSGIHKPNVCAPAPSTSMAAPIVSGAAAILMQRNQSALSDRARDIKATIIRRSHPPRRIRSAPQGIGCGVLGFRDKARKPSPRRKK